MTDQTTKEQPLVQHLIELRSCLLKAFAGILVIFLLLIGFANHIYVFVASPLLSALPEGGKMIATEVTSPFLTPIKLTLWISLFLAIPWVIYQIWSFVAPGLYDKEKKLVFPILFSSILLFYLGMLFAYYAVMPVMFKFLVNTAPIGVEVATDIERYLSVVLRLFFIFGVAFEIPIIIILLVLMNAITIESIQNKRRYIIVGAFIVAAIITPPDVFSQIFFACAALILFELGIFIARRLTKIKK